MATRSPTARPSGDVGADLLDVPTSMPPEPVTGFCILPRVRDDVEHLARGPRRRRRRACVASWRYDAASRLSRSTRIRTSSGHSSGSGVQPPGRLRQHAGRLQHPVQAHRGSRPCRAQAMSPRCSSVRMPCADSADTAQIVRRGSSGSEPQCVLVLCQSHGPHLPGTAAMTDTLRSIRIDRHPSAGPASRTPTGAPSWSSPTGPGSRAGRTSPPRSGLGAVAARALREERRASCAACSATWSTSASTPTSSATRPSGRPCRCCCRRRC